MLTRMHRIWTSINCWSPSGERRGLILCVSRRRPGNIDFRPGAIQRVVTRCNGMLLAASVMAVTSCGNSLLPGRVPGTPVDDSQGSNSATAGSAIAVDFSADELQHWDERAFAGHTQYVSVTEDNRTALQATTEATASLLFRRQTVDLSSTPILEWSWKISSVLPTKAKVGDQTPGSRFERTKAGDDFPARIYVVYQPGILPTEARAINYVWSSHEPVGEHWRNPYQSSAQMIVVESGAERIGQWVTITRNVKEDFKRFFDIDTNTLHGFAVMVDGDNTGSSTTSWFDYLKFTQATTEPAAGTD